MNKRRVIIALRVGFSLLLLGVLWWRIPDFDVEELFPEWTPSTFAWLGGAILLGLLSVVVSALRWQQSAEALGIHLPLGGYVKTYFAGQFVSNALPTTIGGDALRVARLARRIGNTERAFASVVIERLTGWVALPTLTLLGFALEPSLLTTGAAAAIALGLAIATLLALAVVLFAAGHPRFGGRFAERGDWLRFIDAVHQGIDALRRSPRQAVRVLVVAIAYQIVVVSSAWMIARALDIPALGPSEMLAFFPAVAIAQILPISISGLGVREGLFLLFLTSLGSAAPEAEAVALGLAVYLVTLIVSLPGAPAFVAADEPKSEIPTRT